MISASSLLQVIVIVTILVGSAMWAKTYFRKAKLTKEDKENWKKHASNHNKDLDAAYGKKDDKTYNDYLHPKASRFMPKIPYRIDGQEQVMKKVKWQMEQIIGTTSPIAKSEEIYQEVFLVTYYYMTDAKIGDKFAEGSGKVTRVWARVGDGWKLVHEHISEN
jgi:ketosteroid isomerase-like protein